METDSPSGWSRIALEWPEDPPAAIREYARSEDLVWLDGQTSGARRSLVAILPAGVLEQRAGRPAEWRLDGRVADRDVSAWRLWRRVIRGLPRYPAEPAGLGPGWLGSIAYEAAGMLERLPARDPNQITTPLFRMGLYPSVVALDNERRQAELLSVGDAPAAALSELAERWNAAVGARGLSAGKWTPRLVAECERMEYEALVRRALEYIRAGDCYQVNLSQRMSIEPVPCPWEAYARLRQVNPAPFSALLTWEDQALLSVSPELFLQTRDRDALTSPIKGTRPRIGDAAVDKASRRDLIASEKEAAELAMIVDLHRNDLGRVCEYGSVRVARPRRIEAHPTVLHGVADVRGRLRPECDSLDLLMACFPAGSITGAPKIRAMEIIHELEPVPRGIYTGAIGALGLDDSLTMSVAIRTAQWHAGRATLHAGGGIVADSDPGQEYEETLAKAAGILRGLFMQSLAGLDEISPARAGETP